MPLKAKNYKGTNWSLLSWASLIFFIVIHLVFNDLGLIRMFELKSKKNQLHAEIQNIKSKIDDKNQEIRSLESDLDYIEKIAREKYKMVKKGEKVYRVRDERTIK
jgi:cell division protein DivIC